MPVVEYADKSIPIVFVFLVNGELKDNIFSFKFKFAIVAYVEVAVLLNKYEVIALNKIDLLDSKELTKKVNQLKKYLIKNNNLEPKIFKISAVTQKGIEEVLRELFENIKLYRQQKNEE